MNPTIRSLVVALLVVALAVVGRPSATAGATTCVQPSADHVAVVIDFGTLSDAPPGMFTECMPFGARANGIDALRGATTGRLAVDNSGKVCGILGYPTNPSPTNCSSPHDGRIQYWAYFLGTERGWEYSAAGAAAVRVSPDVVQGWRYVDVPASGGTSGIVPPRDLSDGSRSAIWSSTCPAIAVPPGSTKPPTVPPEPNGPATNAPGFNGSPPPTTRSTGAGHITTSSVPVGPNSTNMTVARGTTSLASGAITGLQGAGRAKRLTRAEVRSATTSDSSQGSQLGEFLGIGAGMVVIACLLALAVWRSRRRLVQD